MYPGFLSFPIYGVGGNTSSPGGLIKKGFLRYSQEFLIEQVEGGAPKFAF